MHVYVDLQQAVESEPLPDDSQFSDWVNATVPEEDGPAECTIRLVDEQEMMSLNETFRHKQGVTNVLSFPFDSPVTMETRLLGDIVICPSVVEREADEQHKPVIAHWAHLVVHGTLHLLGYDHLTDKQASEMEQHEIQILHQLGFSNPYEVNLYS